VPRDEPRSSSVNTKERIGPSGAAAAPDEISRAVDREEGVGHEADSVDDREREHRRDERVAPATQEERDRRYIDQQIVRGVGEVQQLAQSRDVQARRECGRRIGREEHTLPPDHDRIAMRQPESRDDPAQLDVHERTDRDREAIERGPSQAHGRREQDERVPQDRQVNHDGQRRAARRRVSARRAT
jgi:hypothetical protein